MKISLVFACILAVSVLERAAAQCGYEGTEIACWQKYDSSLVCQCNIDCDYYGNCCADYYTNCDALQCNGRCNTPYDSGYTCHCEASCLTYNNCCDDYASLCAAQPIDSAELSTFADTLYDLDTNRANSGMYTINKGIYISQPTLDISDPTATNFFSFLDESILSTGTYPSFSALFDHYDERSGYAEVVPYQQRDDIIKFVDAIMATQVMTETYNFLQAHNYAYKNFDEFRGEVEDIWFSLVNPGIDVASDSCGFENTFLGEAQDTSTFRGLHNWVRLYKLQQNGYLNYHGWSKEAMVSTDHSVYYVQFDVTASPYNYIQPESSIMVGVSPEFEIALMTVSFLNSNRNAGSTTFHLNGNPVAIAIEGSGLNGDFIKSAYWVV